MSCSLGKMGGVDAQVERGRRTWQPDCSPKQSVRVCCCGLHGRLQVDFY